VGLRKLLLKKIHFHKKKTGAGKIQGLDTCSGNAFDPQSQEKNNKIFFPSDFS